ncbi:MAG TPA: PilZ domain-containing protein [Vicinamibacterales bacterium]
MKANSQPEGVPATGVENRRSARKPAALVPSITGARLSPVGGEAVLVNISATGVLVRCMTRLRPDTAVNVVFEGGFSPSSVPGRIVRSVVAQIDGSGKLWFDLGIAFKKPIAFDEAPAPIEVSLPTPTAQAPLDVAGPAVNRW